MSNLQQTCKLAINGKININRQDTINEILHKLSVKSIDNLLPSERAIVDVIMSMPPAEPEVIHCEDCIYYDPEHIEKDGVRYEYSDMPIDAFDILGTNLVNSKYGVNVGGRCCRDYNVGYPEDKRVFVSEQNYCGRADRKEDDERNV